MGKLIYQVVSCQPGHICLSSVVTIKLLLNAWPSFHTSFILHKFLAPCIKSFMVGNPGKDIYNIYRSQLQYTLRTQNARQAFNVTIGCQIFRNINGSNATASINAVAGKIIVSYIRHA